MLTPTWGNDPIWVIFCHHFVFSTKLPVTVTPDDDEFCDPQNWQIDFWHLGLVDFCSGPGIRFHRQPRTIFSRVFDTLLAPHGWTLPPATKRAYIPLDFKVICLLYAKVNHHFTPPFGRRFVGTFSFCIETSRKSKLLVVWVIEERHL